MDSRADGLRASLRAELGPDADAWEPVVALAPGTVEAALPWLSGPGARGALSARDRALVLVAVDSCSTHRDESAVRAHVRSALEAGATADQVLEAAELASVVGMHSLTFGLPLLDDELRAQGGDQAVQGDTDRVAALRREFIDESQYWERFEQHLGGFTDAVLRLDPSMFEAFMAFTSRAWRDGSLEPKLKELIYVALDVVAEHQYEPGLRIHLHNAMAFGATADEVLEVMELVSLQGFQALTLTARILTEELDR
jgi:alkylhydroperoxidase/carboxymuconolactone decarboxylase family protein YurZ